MKRVFMLALISSRVVFGFDGQPFEVASIKRSAPVERQARGFLPTPGRFTAADVPASALIGYAYRNEMDEMRGEPEWSTKENYDVVAPYPPGTTPDQIASMLRKLLVERFHLAMHFEQEPRDVLSLVLVQLGAPRGLRPIDVDCDALAAASRSVPPPPSLSPAVEMPPCGTIDAGRVIRSGGTPLKFLANRLTQAAGRHVLDDTGLTGAYAFDLKFSPNLPGWPEPSDEYPELATALRDQLGLKLVPKKASVKILVVDRYERPSDD